MPASSTETNLTSPQRGGARSGAYTGFGLGLAIVKRAVGWHGGAASVDRSSLGGARFVIEWPVDFTGAQR